MPESNSTEIKTIDFKKIVEAAGIPTDEDGWKAEFKKDVEDQGSIIANDSPFSPFWRLITAIVSKPVVWIINKVLIEKILPNLFLMTATDDEFIEAKAWEHDLTRKQEQKAQGKARFIRAASQGPALLIGAGTVVQTDPIKGVVYRIITLDDVVLAENEQSILVPAIAEHAGAAFNLGAGYYHILPESVTGIVSVTNDAEWLDVLGSDAESNHDLKLRTRNAFTAAAQWHIDAVYRKIITEQSGLNTDNVFFEHDAPRGPGTANCYILLDTGEPSNEMITDLNQHVMSKGNHGHGDDMQILAMPDVAMDIAVTVYHKAYLQPDEIATLLNDVEDFIRCAFRENSNYQATRTTPTGRFSFSRLGGELGNQFAGIDSLSWAQGDIVSELNVPRLNSLTVTNGGV